MKNKALLPLLMLTALPACAPQLQSSRVSPVFAACPLQLPVSTLTDASANNRQPRCAQQTSIYSNALWIPLFGPLWELSHNSNPGQNKAWYALSTPLPLIGPALQFSLGDQQCSAECLPMPETALGDNPAPAELSAYVDKALAVSDSNCQIFMDKLSQSHNPPVPGAEQLPASDSQQLLPLLSATIKANRQVSRIAVVCSPLNTAELVEKVNRYDNLCSVESAMDAMINAAQNQNTSNGTGNKEDQYAWLKQHGMTRQPVTHIGASTPVPNPECPGPPKQAKAVSHINNIKH